MNEQRPEFDGTGKFRNWCFTLYNTPNILPKYLEKIEYMVYQKEKCPTSGKTHWQGYVEFKQVRRFEECKLALNDNSVHVEPRWSTQENAIKYCQKKETRLEEPVVFGTPKTQGNRSDLESINDAIQSGMTLKEILRDFGGQALRLVNMISRAQRAVHDVDYMDAFILMKRKLASEVGGNTKPPTIEDYPDDQGFEMEQSKVKRLKRVGMGPKM